MQHRPEERNELRAASHVRQFQEQERVGRIPERKQREDSQEAFETPGHRLAADERGFGWARHARRASRFADDGAR